MKKVVKVIGHIFTVFLILISVTLILEKVVLKKDIPTLFGYSFLEIQSNSMMPSIKKGNMIIIKKNNNYKVGDVVTYRDNSNNYITHQIISITNNNIITKGTNNNTSDKPFVAENVLGKVTFVLPLSRKNIFTIALLVIIVSFVFSLFTEKKQLTKNSAMACSIIIITSLGSSIAYGTYKTVVSVNGSVNAAEFVTETNIENSISYLITDMYPGQEESYSFYISNYNDSKRTDVDTNYTISIEKSNNLPLVYELYKDSINTNILNNDLKTNNQLFQYDTNQTHNYELVITWDISDNSPEYAGLVEYVDIIINSNQVIETSS